MAETKTVLHQTRRNFHSRDRFTFVKLYKQYVRPHLEFASQAWSPWLTGDKEVLEKVQRKAVGIRLWTERKELRGKMQGTGLGDPRDKKNQAGYDTGVHKLLSNGGGGEMFTKAENHEGARTRQAAVADGPVVPFARTDIRKYSFASRTVERCNSLPNGARAGESQQAFKALLKTTKM